MWPATQQQCNRFSLKLKHLGPSTSDLCMKGKGEVKQNAHKYGQEEGRVSLYCSNNLKSCEYGMWQEMMTAQSTCTDTQTTDCTV